MPRSPAQEFAKRCLIPRRKIANLSYRFETLKHRNLRLLGFTDAAIIKQAFIMAAIIELLAQRFGDSGMLSADALAQRATSYWSAEPTRALALLRPRTTAELSDIMQLCHRHDQPVVVQGGLTGCVEGAVANEHEVIISLERMTAIEDVDALGGTATVQAGVILETLQNQLADQNLLFPLDLGARGSCTIGGNIATNAGGINVLRYGMMRELVLGLETVLADGTILSSMNRMLKNNAGYDLKQLFIGSEGTLGIVTRAVVKVFPAHQSRNSALVALRSFGDVAQLLQKLRSALAGSLSAFELMWGDYFHTVTEPGWHRTPMARDYPFYVMIEAEGADPQTDTNRFNQVLENTLTDGLIVDAVIPKSESERRALWDIREDFEAILQNQPCYLYDVSLPLTDMPHYVEQLRTSLAKTWPDSKCFVLGHIADGNLHLFVCPGAPGDLHHQCDAIVYPLLQQFTGSVSAEHGIGTEKLDWLGSSRNATEIEMMQTLKAALDPKGILNRGRLLAQ